MAIVSINGGCRQQQDRAAGALESLDVFMADMQTGIGPFRGVFLQQRGWATGQIGTAIGGWLAQVPGYPVTFYILRSFAVIGVGLRIGFAVTLRPACAGASAAGESRPGIRSHAA